MPQFKVAKTDNKDKLNNNSFTEDKLYIYKETNKLGRLFYDFDDNTRIELGHLNEVYEITRELPDNVSYISIISIRKFDNDDSGNSVGRSVNIDEIQINSIVTNRKSIYYITGIDKNTGRLYLRKIYTPEKLTWTDYYE